MTAPPLDCMRPGRSSLRLRTQPVALVIVLLVLVLASSCAPLGQSSSPPSTTPAAHGVVISAGLPSAVVGSPYESELPVLGGTSPYKFSILEGDLPPGVSLNVNTGLISGRPTTASMYSFLVSVTDLEGEKAERRLSLMVERSRRSFPPIANFVLSPSTATVTSGATEQFTSKFRGTSNTAVEWTATLGKISSSGLFTAPTVNTTRTVVVKATSVADPSAEATGMVTIVPASQLPPPPPPPQGVPGAVTGADNMYCAAGDQPEFGMTDGPANLPQKCLNTALSNTPSRGKQTLVPAGADLKSIVSSASCGDVILLQAGATFEGPITLPAKNCDSQHWITVRTSAADSSLPPEGTRLTPCYAGVSSLPGRPAYSCPSAQNLLAKIQIASGAGAITVAPGGNHYRFFGLEITRRQGAGTAFALVKMTEADHLIFDRVWIHGTALDETTRGIYLGDSTSVAVIDSYLNDFHCISVTGACTDSQAINGGNSTLPNGPYKIVNNFLESAGENILLGGAQGSTVPADIEIRRNHMFKPLHWMPGSANFIGRKFIAKNLFEIKNAERLLFEGNVLENSWGGFSQVGWGIVITPRGSWAADRDITIRYNTISHVGSGFQICATRDTLPNGQKVDSIASERISIHDVIVDDMSASAYNGAGIGFQISSGFVVNRPLNNLTIDHVTILTDPKKTLLLVGADRRNPARPFNIVFTNNLAVAGAYSVWSTGGVYTGECATSSQPLITFNQCWSTYTATNNAIIAYPSTQGPWPKGNFFPATDSAVGFTNFSDGNAGDYQLLSSSPYDHVGVPSGTPLGADVNTILAKLAGVR
jgi:Putative Ig domain